MNRSNRLGPSYKARNPALSFRRQMLSWTSPETVTVVSKTEKRLPSTVYRHVRKNDIRNQSLSMTAAISADWIAAKRCPSRTLSTNFFFGHCTIKIPYNGVLQVLAEALPLWENGCSPLRILLTFRRNSKLVSSHVITEPHNFHIKKRCLKSVMKLTSQQGSDSPSFFTDLISQLFRKPSQTSTIISAPRSSNALATARTCIC